MDGLRFGSPLKGGGLKKRIINMGKTKEQIEIEYLKRVEDLRASTHQTLIKQALDFVPKGMNLAYIAEHYFGKSRSWLSQRINGNIVNGKPCGFTEDELVIFRKALRDMSHKLSVIAENI